MEYVAGAVQTVIVKPDFVRNHAILHSCDNLTIFFSTLKHSFLYSYVKEVQVMSSNGEQLFSVALSLRTAQRERLGEALAPSPPPLFLKNKNKLIKK